MCDVILFKIERLNDMIIPREWKKDDFLETFCNIFYLADEEEIDLGTVE
jgi:hypothetical protein